MAREIGVDIEFENRIFSVGISDGERAEAHVGSLVPGHYPDTAVGHNVKYDKPLLADVGVTFERWRDSILEAHFLGYRPLALKKLSGIFLNRWRDSFKEAKGGKNRSLWSLQGDELAHFLQYNADDAFDSLTLHKMWGPEVERQWGDLYDRALKISDVLSDMERAGMPLDQGRLQTTRKTAIQVMGRLEKKLRALGVREPSDQTYVAQKFWRNSSTLIKGATQSPGEVAKSAGGEVTGKNPGRFILEMQDSDAGREKWLVRFEPEGRGAAKEPIDVAGIWHENDSLKFKWLNGAVTVPADYLRTCILEVDVGNEIQPLAMIRPKLVEPITIDLKRKSLSTPLELGWQPDKDRLRLEVTRLEGVSQEYVFHPIEPVVGINEVVSIACLALDKSMNKKQAVVFRVRLVPSTKSKPLTFQYSLVFPKPSDFKKVASVKQEDKQKYDNQLNGIQSQIELVNESAVPEPVKTRQTEQLNLMKKNIEAAIEKFEVGIWYANFYKAVHNQGKIHYRVITEAGDRQVVLAGSEGV